MSTREERSRSSGERIAIEAGKVGTIAGIAAGAPFGPIGMIVGGVIGAAAAAKLGYEAGKAIPDGGLFGTSEDE
jgi:hypothetical protein